MKRAMALCSMTMFASIAYVYAQPQAPAPKPTLLKPGKPFEKCMVLDSGQKIEYRFDTSAKVNFNLHYNKGDAFYYPVKLDRTTGESGRYEVRSREKYCLAWENRTDADVELNYTIKTGK